MRAKFDLRTSATYALALDVNVNGKVCRLHTFAVYKGDPWQYFSSWTPLHSFLGRKVVVVNVQHRVMISEDGVTVIPLPEKD